MQALNRPAFQATGAGRSAGRRNAVRPVASAHKVSKPTLFDVPVSNNGARVRYIIYKKGLESQFDIVAPQTLGGLKSPEYLKLNPQGKMPLLVLPDGTALPESEVISQYILDKYASSGPSLVADTPEKRAVAALATRIHDIYITSIQACMYRAMDIKQREREIGQIAFQLDVIESLALGPYLAGDKITAADAALLPTFVFMNFMLPKFFHWGSVFTGRPKLEAWWRAMCADDAGRRIVDEVTGGLKGWESAHRWRELGIEEQVADKSHKWSY